MSEDNSLVEAVARAIQDAHAPGHPLNHVSIYQARAAIATLRARGAEPASDPCKLPAEHPDDIAVDQFAAAMKEKLARKRAEGRGGWQNRDECSAERLSSMLRDHVSKGDPVDVANFAMMLHQRSERIVPAEPAGEEPLVWSVRRKGTHEMVWDDGGFIAARKDEAEHFAGYFVNHEAFPLYARPATPTNPERLVDDMAASLRELVAAMRKYEMDVDSDPPELHRMMMWKAERLIDLSAAPLKEGKGE